MVTPTLAEAERKDAPWRRKIGWSCFEEARDGAVGCILAQGTQIPTKLIETYAKEIGFCVHSRVQGRSLCIQAGNSLREPRGPWSGGAVCSHRSHCRVSATRALLPRGIKEGDSDGGHHEALCDETGVVTWFPKGTWTGAAVPTDARR